MFLRWDLALTRAARSSDLWLAELGRRRPRNGTEPERPSDVASDLGYAAAEIECIARQIVVSRRW